MSGIQPTRAAVRALDAAHGVDSAATVVDNAVKAAVQARVTATSLSAVSAELNISESRLQRYLTGTPHKGDVMAIQLMWESWEELLPTPALTSANYDLVDSAGGDVIIVTGTGLAGVTAASWGGTACTVGATTATTASLTMPAKAAGTYALTVTSPGGTSASINIESWGFSDGAFSGLWSNSYAASPWAGEASAGASSGRNLSEATNPPSAGTGAEIVNGHTPAKFDGTNDILTGAALTTLLSNTGYEGFVLFRSSTAEVPNGNPALDYQDPCILVAAASTRFTLSYTNLGVTLSHLAGDGARPRTTQACATGGVHLAQFWFDAAGSINVSIDGAAPATTVAATTANLSANLGVGGLGLSSTKFFNGLIWAAGTAASLQGATFRSRVRKLVNLKYGTAF